MISTTSHAEFLLIAGYVFLFGLTFGSFLNVCIYRLPRGLSVVSPRSACPECRSPVRAKDNIPVLSWLLLRGRCRDCKAPIAARYLGVELLTGALFVGCMLRWGVSFTALKFALFSFLVLGLIFTDLELRLLPDKMTLPGTFFGLALAIVTYVSGPAFLFMPMKLFGRPQHLFIASLLNAMVGCAFGAGLTWGVAIAYEKIRGVEGMGFGDVKMMAMIGAFLGLNLTIFTLLLASFAGSLIGALLIVIVYLRRFKRATVRGVPNARAHAWRSALLLYRMYEMPFGVFLGVGALAAAFFGDSVVRWYWRLYL